MREFLPSRTVFGLASIDGRTVALSGEDFTARPASGSSGVSNREELEAKLISTRSPFRTAEPFNIEDITDPRDTRPVLREWLQPAYDALPPTVGRKTRGMRP